MQTLAGRYELIRSLSKGGMGAVYEARDLQDGSVCAVKEMLETLKESDNAEIFRRRFLEESKLLKRLDHPGIPKARDSFQIDTNLYIVMDFVDGANLEQELSDARALTGHPMKVEVVLDAAIQVLEILAYLHEMEPPVVHRDVKPANIIRDFKTGRIKLVDFGMARSVSLDRNSLQTMVGTLVYCSLEQMQGHAEPRSDLYSLGVSMFELLTGTTPAFLKVPSILEVADDLDGEVGTLVDRATKVKLEDRIGSAREMHDALQGCLLRIQTAKRRVRRGVSDEVVPAPPPPPQVAPSPRAPEPEEPKAVLTWTIALAVVALLGLAGIGLGLALGGDEGHPSPQPTRAHPHLVVAPRPSTPQPRPTERPVQPSDLDEPQPTLTAAPGMP